MKLMLDSSVIFALDDEYPDLLNDMLAVADRLDLITTHIQADEDARGSRAYRRLVMRQVPTSVFVLDYSRLGAANLGAGKFFEGLRDGNLKHTEDAIIMDAAIEEGAVLVIRDERAVRRLRRAGADLEVWGIADLRAHVDGLLAGDNDP